MTAGIVLSRRSNLGAPSFVPPQQASLKTWVRPSGLAAFANNDPIGSWPDAGPGNLPAVQATAGLKPLAKTNVLNGLTVVEFDGVDDLLATGLYAVTAAQPVTRFLVARYLQVGGNQYLMDGYTVNEMAMGNFGTTAYGVYAGGSPLYSGLVDTSWHIFSGVMNGASSVFRVDGGAGATGSPGGNNLSGLTLGNSASGPQPAHCQIVEASATAALLTLAEINQWGAYLAAETGLSWTTAS